MPSVIKEFNHLLTISKTTGKALGLKGQTAQLNNSYI